MLDSRILTKERLTKVQQGCKAAAWWIWHFCQTTQTSSILATPTTSRRFTMTCRSTRAWPTCLPSVRASMTQPYWLAWRCKKMAGKCGMCSLLASWPMLCDATAKWESFMSASTLYLRLSSSRRMHRSASNSVWHKTIIQGLQVLRPKFSLEKYSSISPIQRFFWHWVWSQPLEIVTKKLRQNLYQSTLWRQKFKLVYRSMASSLTSDSARLETKSWTVWMH